MKKIVLCILFTAILAACKNGNEKAPETETPTQPETTVEARTYQGDFIDTAGAMVLMGPNYIYGVKHNKVSEQLADRVARIKQNDYDMVGVLVRGTVSKNTDKESEWEEEITLTEIVRVNDKPSEADIKLNETAKQE